MWKNDIVLSQTLLIFFMYSKTQEGLTDFISPTGVRTSKICVNLMFRFVKDVP